MSNSEHQVWVIIRTEFKHEAKVYRAMVDMGHDAWLPQMPGTSRMHRKTKHRREWWKPTMPTVFFAKVNPLDVMHLQFIPYFRGIERRWSGDVIVLGEQELLRFRGGIDAENREILRIGRRIAAELEPRPPGAKVSKPSRRLKRPSVKQPVRSHELVSWTQRLIKAEQTQPCKTRHDLLHTAADRIRPDPQATQSVEPRGLRPEPAEGAD